MLLEVELAVAMKNVSRLSPCRKLAANLGFADPKHWAECTLKGWRDADNVIGDPGCAHKQIFRPYQPACRDWLVRRI